MIQALLLLVCGIVRGQYIDLKEAKNISLETVFEFKSIQFNTTQKSDYKEEGANPSTIRFNTKGELFVSIPRNGKNPKNPGTFFKVDSTGKFSPWPNEKLNNYTNGVLQSVVGFEIDLNNDIWLLNHKSVYCELLQFSDEGNLKNNYSLQDSTNSSSYLSSISLDNKNKFAFIADSQSNLNEDDFKNYAIILVNLKTRVSRRILGDTLYIDTSLNKNYLNINLNTVSLRCDKRYLFYSAFKSKNLTGIRTSPLRKNQSIEEGTTFPFINNAISEDIISSARGHFYFTSLEDQEVHQQFHEKYFKFNNIQRIGWFDKKTEKKQFFPKSIAFNGTSGYLYVLMSNVSRYYKTQAKSKYSDIYFGLYKAYVDDRSYLYECNIEENIGIISWMVVVMLSFLLTLAVIYFINFLTTSSNQPKINDKGKGYEEDGILLEDSMKDKDQKNSMITNNERLIR